MYSPIISNFFVSQATWKTWLRFWASEIALRQCKTQIRQFCVHERPARYAPCSCTSPFRQRRHTLVSPGRRSGCLIRPRCTRTGCTVGTASYCYRRESRRTGASRVCPWLYAPPGRRGQKIKMSRYRQSTLVLLKFNQYWVQYFFFQKEKFPITVAGWLIKCF